MARYLKPDTVVACAGPAAFLDSSLQWANDDPSFPTPGESVAWLAAQGDAGRAEAPLPRDSLVPVRVEEAIAPQSRELLAIPVFGYPWRLEAPAEIAWRDRLLLIYDSAPSFGNEVAARPIGSDGDASMFR